MPPILVPRHPKASESNDVKEEPRPLEEFHTPDNRTVEDESSEKLTFLFFRYVFHYFLLLMNYLYVLSRIVLHKNLF